MTDDHSGGSGIEESAHGALPHPRDLLAALALLTAVPLPRPDEKSAAFARATLFFPLTGLFIGTVLVGLDWLLGRRLPAWAGALVLVATWEALGRVETLRSWRTLGGSLGPLPGLAVMAAILLAKIAAVAVAGGPRTAALLFAPMLARWSMVVLVVGARDARAPGSKFNPAITFREFALTSVFTCAVVFTVAEALGIFIVVCVAAVNLAGRLLTHRWAEGVSWPLLLAGAEGVETLVVVLCALF